METKHANSLTIQDRKRIKLIEDDIKEMKTTFQDFNNELKESRAEKKAYIAEIKDKETNESKANTIIMTGIDQCFIDGQNGKKRADPVTLQTILKKQVSPLISINSAYILKHTHQHTTVKVTFRKPFMAELVKQKYTRDAVITATSATTIGTQIRFELLQTLTRLLTDQNFQAYMEPNHDHQPMINIKRSNKHTYEKYSFTDAITMFRNYFTNPKNISKTIRRLAAKFNSENKRDIFIVLN